MFNRKLFFILLVVSLFILHISSVCAVNSNETHAIEFNKEYDLSVKSDSKQGYVSKIGDSDDNSLDFNQGDKIPITIDCPNDGNLTVLVDDEVYYYESWFFLDDETINIPTYNPSSFYNSSIKNIGVGTHKISLVFKYTHNLTLNIHEKRKTINVSIFNKPTYHYFIDFSVGFDNDTLMDMLQDDTYLNHFGIIFSNNEKILYKDVFDLKLYDMDCIKRAHVDISYPVIGITFDVGSVLGICNLTVVNFADGTTDTVLFNVSKFITGIPKIECVINGFDATFYGDQYYTKIFVNMEKVHKFISAPVYENFWNVTFVNLSPGVHVLRLYYPETDFIKQFSYNWTILGNHSFNMLPNMLLTNGGAFLFFSQNDGMQNIEDFWFIDEWDVENSELKLGSGSNSIGESNSIGINGGNSGSSESSSSSNKKSYEIQEKSTSKVIDNSLIKLGLIIILTISFMMGLVRFKKRVMQ